MERRQPRLPASAGWVFVWLGWAGLALAGLPPCRIAQDGITVSGLSAGGFMAVQLHIAYSRLFAGVGVVAGGPYYCSLGNLATARTACMATPGLISVPGLLQVTRNTALTGTIDPLSFVSRARVFLFSGTADTVVRSGVVSKLAQYYLGLRVSPANLSTQFGLPAEHAFVTPGFGNNCSFKGPPFINHCGQYDTAGAMLQRLYPDRPLVPRSVSSNASLIEFAQAQFLPAGYTLITAGLAETGYAYVPAKCAAGAECRLHVALHGCKQNSRAVGRKFVEHTFNGWAEPNNIVVLYPQARATVLNPNGCFDWWGYTGPDFACKLGAQMVAIKRMVDAVTSGSLAKDSNTTNSFQ